jgi:hypothetical protein
MRAMECDWIEEAAAAREFALKQGTIDLAMTRIADLYVTRLSNNIASRSS